MAKYPYLLFGFILNKRQYVKQLCSNPGYRNIELADAPLNKGTFINYGLLIKYLKYFITRTIRKLNVQLNGK